MMGSRENFVRPCPMTCNACGTTGIAPRIVENNMSRTEVITEAKWICSRCGNLFFNGIISRTPRKVS